MYSKLILSGIFFTLLFLIFSWDIRNILLEEGIVNPKDPYVLPAIGVDLITFGFVFGMFLYYSYEKRELGRLVFALIVLIVAMITRMKGLWFWAFILGWLFYPEIKEFAMDIKNIFRKRKTAKSFL